MDIGDKILLAACAFPLVCLLCAWIRHKTHPGEGFVIYDRDPDLPRSEYADVTLGDICNGIRDSEKERQRERDERQARRERGRGQDWWF